MKYRPAIKAEQRWLYGLISWILLVCSGLLLVAGAVMLSKALSGNPPHLRSGAIWDAVKVLGFGVAFGVAGVIVRVMLRRWDLWYSRLGKTEEFVEWASPDFRYGMDKWLHRWVDWWARLWDRAETRSKKKRKRLRRNSDDHV